MREANSHPHSVFQPKRPLPPFNQVLIIDDHPVVLNACRDLLRATGVGSVLLARKLADGFRLYRDKAPDLIIMDLAIGARPLAGLSFIRRLRVHDAQIPILVFSMHDDALIASEALRFGANGYIVKDSPPDDIAVALNRVGKGSAYLSPGLASRVAFMEARRRSTNPVMQMTVREVQVLSQLLEGKSHGQIATNLAVSYKTIVKICSRLKAKLGVQSIPELMQVARRHLPSSLTPRVSSLTMLLDAGRHPKKPRRRKRLKSG